MSILLASLHLSDFMFENKVINEEFIGYVGHKEKYEVYGGLFRTNKGLLLQINKHVEINANKPSPKIASEEISKFKFVDETIWDSFKLISWDEHCGRWMVSYKNVKVKGIDY